MILETIRMVSRYAISNETEFTKRVREASQLRQAEAAKDRKRKLNRDRKRSAELDGLIKKLYEAFATGKLTEKRFELLSAEYEREQAELDVAIEQAQVELDALMRTPRGQNSSSRWRGSIRILPSLPRRCSMSLLKKFLSTRRTAPAGSAYRRWRFT